MLLEIVKGESKFSDNGLQPTDVNVVYTTTGV